MTRKPTRRSLGGLSPKNRARLRAAAAELSKKWGRRVSEAEVFNLFVDDMWDRFIAAEKKRRAH